MTKVMKKIFAVGLLTAVVPLVAQEPWDPQLKLTAGTMSGAEDNLIGQSKAYGIALAGVYPLSVHGAGMVEFGYKFFPATTQNDGMTTIDDKSDIYYLGAMYRYELWRNGIYVQAGARATNALTERKTTLKGIGELGGDVRRKEKSDRVSKIGWCFGLGYRLTSLWSLEFTASAPSFNNLNGQSVSGTLIEAALVIHR